MGAPGCACSLRNYNQVTPCSLGPQGHYQRMPGAYFNGAGPCLSRPYSKRSVVMLLVVYRFRISRVSAQTVRHRRAQTTSRRRPGSQSAHEGDRRPAQFGNQDLAPVGGLVRMVGTSGTNFHLPSWASRITTSVLPPTRIRSPFSRFRTSIRFPSRPDK